jgi:hypothetical protein
MLRANSSHSLVTLTWRGFSKIAHRGDVLIMKRSETSQGSRRHAIVKMLVALVAISAIFGPTLLVVTDAWAKGPGSGSGASGGGNSGSSGGGNGNGAGTPGGAGNSGGATGGPGASGGGGNSGGGNGGGNGNGNGNGGAGAAGNGASGVGGGNGNGVGGGNGSGSGGGAGSGGGGSAGGSGSGGSGSGGSGSGGSGSGGSGSGGSGSGGSGSGAGASGGGNSGGGNASAASSGGSSAGDGGSGASAAGNGGSGGGIITYGGAAQDARIASTKDVTPYRFLPGGVRKGTAFLTPNQEYTVDVFNACKAETRVHGAFLTILKTNGGFGFDNGEDNRGTQLLINCMASYGFTFPSVAVGPVENLPAVADVPEAALVNEAGGK